MMMMMLVLQLMKMMMMMMIYNLLFDYYHLNDKVEDVDDDYEENVLVMLVQMLNNQMNV